MFETQTAQTRMDERNRCRDRAWLSTEDERRFGEISPVNHKDTVETGLYAQKARANMTFRPGQEVFLSGDQLIGRITKLFSNPNREITHLAVQTARLFGQHKLVPVALVGDTDAERVHLTITREQFVELPGFKADSIIAREVDRALWNDVVLRASDYREIDTQVRDGIIFLNGHVTTGMNQWRAETAARAIPGVLGVSSYLFPDDKLAFEVAEAAGQVDHAGNNKVFTKVENGLALLFGEASSTAIRDEVEQRIAKIPWVRGIINEINVPGATSRSKDQRFLQPLIGKELIFNDAVSATIRKVVINPQNRCVEAVVVLGRFPSLRQEPVLDYEEKRQPERLVVLPVHLILHLTDSAGFMRIDSQQITEKEVYDPARYSSPEADWLPPYPYCTNEVLFRSPSQVKMVNKG